MKDRTFRSQKNIDNALKILEIVINALDKHNVKYYLDFGTLIGAIREQGLIPWDDDIDISLCDESDYKKIPDILKYIKKNHNVRTYLSTFNADLRKRERRENVKLDDILFTDLNNFSIAKVRTNKFLVFGKGSTCIDIFFKYKSNDEIFWMAYGKTNSVPEKYIKPELVEIKFYHLKCKILKEYDEYLMYKYNDWKVPKEDWSHESDDLSIR